jgi:uncharacterized damage-inducible protein DinB
MAEDNFTLTTFYTEWKKYQDHVKEAIAPLTDEQLALRAAPNLRSIRELAEHIVGARVGWFVNFLSEGGDSMQSLSHPVDPDTPSRSAANLVNDLDVTWNMISDCLTRWSAADLQKVLINERTRRYPREESRSWVVWHVLEHDLHHGGEISLTLGMHGLQAPDI